ncbi:hypothetical protein [Cytobacillus sp. IB215665]|nr:hypothetical protein [Cytobacillus sp. IB215665]MDX8367251.1 hypothetical protein [Cytobacillus sp. IB215665]
MSSDEKVKRLERLGGGAGLIKAEAPCSSPTSTGSISLEGVFCLQMK